MKMLSFGFIAFLAYNVSQPLKYYSEGLDDKIVTNALNQWNLRGITYSKVQSPDKANVCFKKSSNLSTPNRYGESNYYEICINTKYKFNDKELTNLISHEFGHYLSLGHNSRPRSIMNNKIKLDNKTVTQEDRDSLHFLHLRILVAKIVGTMYQYSR